MESLGTALTHLKLKKAELDESFADKTRAVIDLGREVAAEVRRTCLYRVCYASFRWRARDRFIFF